ncbi:MAG: hypothetical protein NTV51_10950 [Verrucomicrobia bacterium]|nr:hypothetical protein [Verrucomicrobiota bacterium]
MLLRQNADQSEAREPRRAEFAAQFGSDVIYERYRVGALAFSTLTVAGVCVRPTGSKEETLEACWLYVQEIARWLVARIRRYPDDERFEIIVAWSAPVRARPGPIFKIGGGVGEIVALPTFASWRDYEAQTHRAALIGNWAKGVFPGRKPNLPPPPPSGPATGRG